MFTVKLIKRSGDVYDLHVDGNPSGVLDPGHVKMVDPVVELEENTAGTFSFSLPYGNAGNTNSGFTIDPGSDEIALYQKNENGTDVEIWRGFFLESKGDFWKSGEYECLGELAYLGDSLQEATTYTYDSNTTNYPELYLTALINIHNEKMTALGATNKLFTVGRVTVSADNTAAHIVKYVNTTKFTTSASDNTFDCIKQLISSCGGHLEVRRENGTRYLDYLKDYSTSEQSIDFGTNLIDYEHSLDLTNLVTVLYPYGESETITDEITGTTSRVARNISSINNGRKYITLDDVFPNEGLMDRYGVREGTVVFSNVTTIENIYNLGVKYLQNIYNMLSEEVIACKAVDMAYTNTENGETNVPPIRFLQRVKVTSRPHGLVNKYFPVTKMSIPLSAPENAVYTMAIGATGITQLSTTVTDHGKEQDKIEETVGDLGGEIDDIKGEETIKGVDPTSDWVIGKVTIGKDSSTSAGEKFMPHADHLKLFYDYKDGIGITLGSSLACPEFEFSQVAGTYYWPTPQSYSYVHAYDRGWHRKDRAADIRFAGEDEEGPNVSVNRILVGYLKTIALSGASWSPAYVSDDIKNNKDSESSEIPSFVSGPGGTIYNNKDYKTFACASDPFDLKVYYTGPNDIGGAGHKNPISNSPKARIAIGSAEVQGGSDAYTEVEKISGIYRRNEIISEFLKLNKSTAFSAGCDYTEYVSDGSPGFNIRRLYSSSNIIEARDPGSGIANAEDEDLVFGQYTTGIMPTPMRPLEGEASSAVVYVVCNFEYGNYLNTLSTGILSGVGNNHEGFGIWSPSSPVFADDDHESPVAWRSLCRNYIRTGGASPRAGSKAIALYRLENVASGSGSSASHIVLKPKGHYYAYAWMRNVGKGASYQVTSAITGGLMVATSSTALFTGHVKWTKDINDICEHMPELPYPTDPKEQFIAINQVRRSDSSVSSLTQNIGNDPYVWGDPENIECINNPFGGFGAVSGNSLVQLGVTAVRAIGYSHAAYGQINMDEVAENLKYLYSKYGDGG